MQPEMSEVERLCVQLLLLDEKEISGSIGHTPRRLQNERSAVGSKLLYVHGSVHRATSGEIKEMPPIRQELGPDVRDLATAGVQPCQGQGSAAASGYTHQHARESGGKNDGSFGVPGPPVPHEGADGFGVTVKRSPLQRAVGKKGDGFAVRRPERKMSALRIFQPLRDGGIHGLHPEVVRTQAVRDE